MLFYYLIQRIRNIPFVLELIEQFVGFSALELVFLFFDRDLLVKA